MSRRTLLSLLLVVLAGTCYMGIVVVRQGPPSGGDTAPLTAVTSALASGDLHAAAANDALPDPPGYAWLTAPFAAALPTAVGSAAWCTPPTRAASLREESGYRNDPTFGTDVSECGYRHRASGGALGPPLHPWYRAQGVLGVAGWFVLAAGGLALLRAAGADSFPRRAGLLVFLAFLPAASSAIVQLFHPQDIVSLGLALGGLAATLRRRWVLAGVLFGSAILTKQFAVLMLLPALVVASGAVPRLKMSAAALLVLAAGLAPFLLSAPRATLHNFSGYSAGGAVPGSTVLSLLGASGTGASTIARDAPVVFAVVVCLWADRRRGLRRTRPEALVALALACVGSRLVFESVVFPYYLLAASVLFFMLDLVAQRSPHRSLAWCAGAAFFVALRPGTQAVDALGTLTFAVLAVVAGLGEVVHLSRADVNGAPASELCPTPRD